MISSASAGRLLTWLLLFAACAEPNRLDPNEVVRMDAADAHSDAVVDARGVDRLGDDSPSMNPSVDLGVDSPIMSPTVVDAADAQSCGEGSGQSCCEGATRPCTTVCGMGIETCRGGVFGTCSARQPTSEACSNTTDDDCDGMSDCLDTDCGGKSCATERVCSGKRCVPVEAIFLFLPSQKYDGALGGREGADAKCSSESTKLGLACKNVRAFLGVSTEDSIGNLASRYNIPASWAVLDLDGSPRYPNVSALVAGETNRNVPIAEFDTDAAPAWWSGAIDNGVVEANYTCRGWTSNSPQDSACVGVLGTKLDQYCYNRYVCASSYRLACLCW